MLAASGVIVDHAAGTTARYDACVADVPNETAVGRALCGNAWNNELGNPLVEHETVSGPMLGVVIFLLPIFVFALFQLWSVTIDICSIAQTCCDMF
jgi:hypothetical protein